MAAHSRKPTARVATLHAAQRALDYLVEDFHDVELELLMLQAAAAKEFSIPPTKIPDWTSLVKMVIEKVLSTLTQSEIDAVLVEASERRFRRREKMISRLWDARLAQYPDRYRVVRIQRRTRSDERGYQDPRER